MITTVRKIKITLPVLLLAVIMLLTACGQASTAEGTQAAGSKPMHKLTLMLDWYPNAVHSFLYAAQEKGYFAEEGLDVDIQMPADSNDALKLVAAGKIDLALSYQPQVLMARGEHIPVTSIAAIVRHPLNHLMVPAASGVKTPADLNGKTVGYSSIPLYEAMVKTMVQNSGGDPGSIKLVDVGFNLIPALATGQTDAIIGGFINHEQLLLEKEGHPVTSLNPTDYGVPDYYELVLVASQQGLQSSKEDFKKFMTAAAKGQQFVKDHPEEALSLLLKHEDQTSPLDPDIEKKSLEILLPLMDAGQQPFGYQDPASWTKVEEWLKSNKLLPSGISGAEAFVNL